jgi:hypothetical protein
MATKHYWRWVVTEEWSGRRIKTRHVMTEADALERDPTAEKIPGTYECREVPDGGLPAHSTPWMYPAPK